MKCMWRVVALWAALATGLLAQTTSVSPGQLGTQDTEWNGTVTASGVRISLVGLSPGVATIRTAVAIEVCNLEAADGDEVYANFSNPATAVEVDTIGPYTHPSVRANECRRFDGRSGHTAALLTQAGESAVVRVTAMHVPGGA